MEFKTLQSEQHYQGRAFSVRRDQVQLPDGRTSWLDIVDHRGAITILPVDAAGEIWFVRQYRHPAGRLLLELPAGTLEPAEDPQKAALRELREEIGMRAEKLHKISEFYLAPGYSTEYMYIYLASELTPAPLSQDEDEYLFVEKIPLRDAYQLLAAGEIKDAKTLLGLLVARPYLLP